MYSSDLEYYVTSEPTDDPDHFVLRQVATGKELQSFPKMITPLEAVWSRDSKRLAIVGVPANLERGYLEELSVFCFP